MTTPKLKVKVQTIREVDAFDLEKWLMDVFNLEHGNGQVSVIADNEWSNGASYTIHAGPDEWDLKRGYQSYEEYIDFWHDEGDYDRCLKLMSGQGVDRIPDSGALIDFAAIHGLMDIGEYTVSVFW
jgi:hypothetical protein